MRAYKREYYLNNKDRINENRRKKYDSESTKEYKSEYYKKNKEKIRNTNKKWRDKNPDYIQKRSEENKRCQKRRARKYKIICFEKIAKYHNTGIACWRCGESRIWCLTIGHPNSDGKTDREKHGNGITYYKAIMEDRLSCENIRLECANCNLCLQWHGKYPDEMTTEDFTMKEND